MKRQSVFFGILILGSMIFGIGCGNSDNAEQQQPEQLLLNQETSDPEAKMTSQKIYNLSVVELQEFVKEASSEARKEVLMAQIAIEQTKRNDLQEFAQALKDEHVSVGRELENIVADNNWYLPDTLMTHHQRMIEQLRVMESPGFDAYYLKTVISAHERAIGKYKNVSERGGSNKVTTWARNTLPALRQHLDRSRALLSSMDEAS